jgi:hypothetical protein
VALADAVGEKVPEPRDAKRQFRHDDKVAVVFWAPQAA